MSDITLDNVNTSFYATILEFIAVYDSMDTIERKAQVMIMLSETACPSRETRAIARSITNPITLCEQTIKEFKNLHEYILKKKEEIDAEDRIRSERLPLDPDAN